MTLADLEDVKRLTLGPDEPGPVCGRCMAGKSDQETVLEALRGWAGNVPVLVVTDDVEVSVVEVAE